MALALVVRGTVVREPAASRQDFSLKNGEISFWKREARPLRGANPK
jgi:hypothetical protein